MVLKNTIEHYYDFFYKYTLSFKNAELEAEFRQQNLDQRIWQIRLLGIGIVISLIFELISEFNWSDFYLLSLMGFVLLLIVFLTTLQKYYIYVTFITNIAVAITSSMFSVQMDSIDRGIQVCKFRALFAAGMIYQMTFYLAETPIWAIEVFTFVVSSIIVGVIMELKFALLPIVGMSGLTLLVKYHKLRNDRVSFLLAIKENQWKGMIESYLPIDIFITEFDEKPCKILLNNASKSMQKYEISTKSQQAEENLQKLLQKIVIEVKQEEIERQNRRATKNSYVDGQSAQNQSIKNVNEQNQIIKLKDFLQQRHIQMNGDLIDKTQKKALIVQAFIQQEEDDLQYREFYQFTHEIRIIEMNIHKPLIMTCIQEKKNLNTQIMHKNTPQIQRQVLEDIQKLSMDIVNNQSINKQQLLYALNLIRNKNIVFNSQIKSLHIIYFIYLTIPISLQTNSKLVTFKMRQKQFLSISIQNNYSYGQIKFLVFKSWTKDLKKILFSIMTQNELNKQYFIFQGIQISSVSRYKIQTILISTLKEYK